MNVSVRNAKDATLVKITKLAVDSFSKNLFSPQLAKNISLKINFHYELGAGGYCDYEFGETGPPRDFTIDILKTRKKIKMFLVLAHEMVHVKQIAKGEMKDKYVRSKDEFVTKWLGVDYNEDVSYWDQPWELEAYGLEYSLVAKFLVEHKQFKNLRQKQADWFVQA